MQSSKLAIVIVAYNTPSLLPRQIDCIKKFCKDDYDVVVVDNSTNKEAIDAVYYWTTVYGTRYIKTNAASKNGSGSHVFACNTSYHRLKDRYSYFFYLDHDNFPIRDFSVVSILDGKAIGGLGQEKSKTYFWAGCVMWNNITIDKSLIDFSTNSEFGLDTGGNLYRVIERYGNDACVFFNEKYYENPCFPQTMYNFYATINDDMFMHFINSSNWNPTMGNEERVNSLLNILEERIQQ